MNTNTLKLGMIGGGVNSSIGYTHVCASQMDKAWQLTCGAFSSKFSINAESGEHYGVDKDRVYDSWQELLNQEVGNIDAIAILSPTPQHEDMIIAALKLGIPVICEKAITYNLASLYRIKSVLEKTNGFLCVTYNYSAYPMVRELRTRILRRELGELKQIQIEMPQESMIRGAKSAKPSESKSWHACDGDIPTIHLDLTTDVHQMIYFLTKRHPISVRAEQNNFGRYPNVVDDISSLIEYEDCFHARTWVSKSALGSKNGLSFRIYGEHASASWQQSEPETLLINYSDGRREIVERGSFCYTANAPRYNRYKPGHPSGFIEAFGNLYTDFANAVIYRKNHRSYPMNDLDLYNGAYSLNTAQEGLEMMEAMNKSSNSKRLILLNASISSALTEIKFG